MTTVNATGYYYPGGTQMGWFQRHLNWTIIIITILSNIVSYFAVSLFLKITHIHYLGPKYSPYDTVIFPAIAFFSLDAHLLLVTILSIMGFRWVLKKKNLHWAYLLFFIAFFILEIPDFLTHIVDLTHFVYEISLPCSNIGMLLWFVGWMFLLTLKNKSIQPADSNTSVS